ncbi:MAG: hypothetical protein MUC50_19165 [Myxococcota bacterium]|jgi:hypothetical protein|nr:hypothetical protein [Myxococcota bacterium]
MNSRPIFFALSYAIAILVFPPGAKAEDEPAPLTEPTTTEPTTALPESQEAQQSDGLGLSFGLSWLSAYNFRGLNLFQSRSQSDPHMLLAPSISWNVLRSGVEVGYWGGYQISGENIGNLIDAGVGAEQDLFVTYTWEMTDWASLTPTLIFYLYPFADEDVAGTAFPGYIDPTLDLALSWAIDFGMKVTYYAGLQSETQAFNHLYLSPSLSRSFALGTRIGLDALLSLGYKVWQDQSLSDNTWDLLFELGLPIFLPGNLTIKPRFQAVWTNLENDRRAVIDPSNPADPVTVTGSKRQEAFVVGGLDLSVSL